MLIYLLYKFIYFVYGAWHPFTGPHNSLEETRKLVFFGGKLSLSKFSTGLLCGCEQCIRLKNTQTVETAEETEFFTNL